MTFVHHTNGKTVLEMLVGKRIVGAILKKHKVILKFSDQNWLEAEIVPTVDEAFELKITFTEWVDDPKEQQ